MISFERHKEKFSRTFIRKVLAIESNRLGDVLSTIPALYTLKTHLPQAEIWFLIRKEFAPLFQDGNIVDRLIIFDNDSGLFHLFRLAAKIRKEKFDLVLSLSPTRRNAFLAHLIRTRWAAGYLHFGKKIPNFLKRNPVSSIGMEIQSPQNYYWENIVETSLKVCLALGFSPQAHVPHLIISEEKTLQIRRKLEEMGLGKSIPFIVIHPFAGWKYREWQKGKIIELINRIIGENSVQIVLLGSAEEQKRLAEIERQISKKENVLVVAGSDFDVVSVLLQQSLLFIGADSGPLHLASAVGTPCIGLFGPAAPEFTAPLRENNYFFYHRLDCSPCHQKHCIHPNHSCLDLISVDEVYKKVKEVLNYVLVDNDGTQ